MITKMIKIGGFKIEIAYKKKLQSLNTYLYMCKNKSIKILPFRINVFTF